MAPARGSAVGRKRGRGWLPPGQSGDGIAAILPAAGRADPASAPKLTGSSLKEVARDQRLQREEDAERATLPGTVRFRALPRALLPARASPYFGISSSRAGQPLLTDSRGDLPLPLLAGCISARHTVGGRGRDEATGHGE